jgi:hypothetical protein
MKTPTPKEKAQELFDEMWHEIAHHNLEMVDINFIAKQCALVAADEILRYVVWSVRVENSMKWNDDIAYWNDVLKEIDNIKN